MDFKSALVDYKAASANLEKTKTNLVENLELPKSFLDDVARLENSDELTNVANDDYFHQWVRLSDESVAFARDLMVAVGESLATELINNKLDSVIFNYDDETLTQSIGPALVISEAGHYSLFDQETDRDPVKRIFRHLDDAIKAAKEYQESIGVFHWIVKVDRYGVPRSVKG